MSQRPIKMWEIPFPALTFCPETQILPSKYNFTAAELKFDVGNLTKEE